jgi:hypothetical protein
MVAAAALPSAANAAQWLVTYQGTTNWVGTAPMGIPLYDFELFDKAFTATFQVDDATPGSIWSGGAESIVLYGTGAASPTQGTFLFEGMEYKVGGETGFDSRRSNGLTTYARGPSVDTEETYSMDELRLQVSVPGAPFTLASLSQGFSGPAMTTSNSYFSSYVLDRTQNSYSSYFFADLNVTNVSVQSLTATVPEPGAWATMIVGFALMGAGLRRSRYPLTAA